MSTNVSIELGAGQSVTIRRVRVDDAAAVLRVRSKIVAESKFHVSDPGDPTRTVEEQARYLEALVADPERLMLVAEHQGAVVGVLEIEREARKRLRHRAEVWTHIDSSFRGQRVGSALAQAALAWAKATPSIEKLVMHVLHTNEASLALVKKYGFVEEGRLVDEVKIAPGVYADLVVLGGRIRARAEDA